MVSLPIDDILPTLLRELRTSTNVVLQAPPGAGKTTRVPLALLDEPWLAGRRILMLEPRRLAARAAAHRMAALRGERTGETVGYRVRMETRVGPRTRVEVVTEGVLTRMLQSDPALDGVGLVIFDEFHERSLHADLGLALCLESQAVLREDLRIIAMSATLDGTAVARLLGDAPVLESRGRSYPVHTRYLERPLSGHLEPAVVRTIREALAMQEGDVLVFLPGAGEIRRVEAQLANAGLDPSVTIAPLYGRLAQDAQNRAIEPSPSGRRKVVLATSIAETSLTIEGVRVVVDSGRMRVPRFSARTGMTRLETVPVSRASAEQRCGRAGRLAPGVCYRLWTEYEQRGLVPHGAAEILEADLAPLALDLAAWGVPDPAALRWLDPPPSGAYNQARELLTELDALAADGTITAHGRRLARLALHPRLAHMLVRGAALGHGALACDLAALLSDRDIFRRGDALPDADARLRVDALRSARAGGTMRAQVDRDALRRAREEARHWRKQLALPANAHGGDTEAVGLLLGLAYPDRIAQRRAGQRGRFLLRNGRGAELVGSQALAGFDYVVAADLDGSGRESRIYLGAPVDIDDLTTAFALQISREEHVSWESDARAVRARRQERLGALVLRDAPLPDPDPEQVLEALLTGIAEEGLTALPWTPSARQLQQRLIFLHRLNAAWPDVSDHALAGSLASWLAPHLHGMKSLDEVQRIALEPVITGMLTREQRAALNEQAPTHLAVPSGSKIAIDYSDPDAPVLAVRLQEMFGLQETPRIARGEIPLTLHLLSPARRPVQVTRDLASFWRSTYFEVRRDLKGRYPKHHWPDDPLQAVPTHRTRPRH